MNLMLSLHMLKGIMMVVHGDNKDLIMDLKEDENEYATIAKEIGSSIQEWIQRKRQRNMLEMTQYWPLC